MINMIMQMMEMMLKKLGVEDEKAEGDKDSEKDDEDEDSEEAGEQDSEDDNHQDAGE